MPTGTLVHIFPNKKLMVKISENTYDSLYNRLYNMSKQKNFPTQYLAVFTKENDDGEDEHFAKLTPDKYDKLNMPMFERLLRKEVGFTTRMKFYDFINDDNEQVCGINLELTSIRQIKPSPAELEARRLVTDEMQRLAQAMDKKVAKPKAEWNPDSKRFEWNPDSKRFEFDVEIDEIADKAAARACSKETELNAEEQAIDEEVEKRVSERMRALEAQMKALDDASDE